VSGSARTLRHVLVIRADLVAAIMAHAVEQSLAGRTADQPGFEACGMVAGPDGSDRPERHIAMTNAALHWTEPQIVNGRERTARTYFDFVGAEKLAAFNEMTRLDESPVVTYHSHSHTVAYPSDVDIEIMSGPLVDPAVHWVVVSTRDDAVPTVPGGHEFRSFRIVDGELVEEEVEVVGSYMFAHNGADVLYPAEAQESAVDTVPDKD
jgi:[CysO sulfur-carrier protein]-S-L-cysteine hydrolase